MHREPIRVRDQPGALDYGLCIPLSRVWVRALLRPLEHVLTVSERNVSTVLPRIARTRSWPVIRGISGLIGMWGRAALFGFALLEAQGDLGEEFGVGRLR